MALRGLADRVVLVAHGAQHVVGPVEEGLARPSGPHASRGVHSFQESFFLDNRQKPWGNGWFLKRTMVETVVRDLKAPTLGFEEYIFHVCARKTGRESGRAGLAALYLRQNHSQLNSLATI